MKGFSVVILAAGKGERMMSVKPKVMHEIMGRPMVGYVIEKAQALSPTKIVAVLGFGRELVEGYVRSLGVECAFQEGQKGTAHAVLAAERFVAGDDILVLYGDVPLIEKETLEAFLSFCRKAGTIVFMTTDVDNPKGYGRVVMEGDHIQRIVEEIDCTPEERAISRINTGICVIPGKLFGLLKNIQADNRKGEYYLTDICRMAQREGLTVTAYQHPIAAEVLGINSRKELLEANITMKDRVLDYHVARGVTILDRNVYIESTVTISSDTTIDPNVYIMGHTRIGSSVTIGPNVLIKDSVIHDGVGVEGFAVIEGAEIQEGVKVGPFSRLRPGVVLKKGTVIGSFAEVKE